MGLVPGWRRGGLGDDDGVDMLGNIVDESVGIDVPGLRTHDCDANIISR